MAAYADVVSLLNTIRHLKDSSRFSIAPTSSEILRFAYNEISPLEDVLRRLDENLRDDRRCERMIADLDGQATEAVRIMEDTLDSLILNQIILLQSDHETSLEDDHEDLKQVRREIDAITGLVKEMEGYFNELTSNPLPEEEDGDVFSSEIDHIGGNKPKMVGFSGEFRLLQLVVSKFRLSHPDYVSYGRFVTLHGMAGVGKTTLAKEIFEHPSTLNEFDCRVWVTVGQKYTCKRIFRRILAQVDPEHYTMTTKVGEREFEGHLNESLKDRDYLIVLDDVWDEEIIDGLQKRLPEKKDQGIVLLTTRLLPVAQKCKLPYKIELLDKEESWDILREKVFGEEPCLPQLAKAGRKIAENCEGLPLLIVEVSKLLSKADKTPEYWNEVAEKRNSVFVDAHDQILQVLRPSYTHLDITLRATFVYMGIFPHKYKIHRSDIMKLWYAEGIIVPLFASEASQSFAVDCFLRLYERNLILDNNRRKYELKTCSLHSVFWHLCKTEAGKNKFFHVLKKTD